MPLLGRSPIRRIAPGRYAVNLGPEDREMILAVATEIRTMFDHTDAPGLHRSFPPAYQGLDNLDHADEYRRLMTEELAERHRDALATLTGSAEATELSEEQLEAWMRALNQLRLVLGTEIGLEGNEDDVPDTVDGHVYLFLTAVQDLVIDALTG